ncbi:MULTISPECIES: diacylglycerol kinase family protein [Acinetobacter]|uniref:Diacylglycerol kinase n=1 Tax=Acinetobacter venetianus TaxID=52133 RepID=A0A150I279_9GAMM|nr:MULTISPECIES: diacylglycerol kinase family protein [Acinetobacter]KXZ73833.1 Diacylglycerol kinase [Acinetobacter venetianus]MBC70341.1 diacylglycerol kinase [Acinetobacter sp.]MBT51528.1 diacylglycerol kinase [Acinetobacter sp.]HIQ34093.1 diacylglycerol kinase [Acinetobacter venetianus]HJP46187.1 diacylglycerol kinase family protein [Acinetobacter venetianus]
MNQNLRPLSIIYNQKSGFHAAQQDEVYERLMTFWTQHGFEIQVFELNQKVDFDELMKSVLSRHQQADLRGVVVAAGGDGTLNAVAKRLMHTNIPMGVIPLGTFNYVARVLDIPIDVFAAADVIATGKFREVHVATINDQIYLNNASLGLYPLFIKKRELYNQHFGRFPLNAYTSGLDVLLREHKSLKLSINVDGQKYPVATPLIFFGNNQLQLCDMKLRIAECAANGKLAGVVVAKSDRFSLLKMLLKLIQGKIEQTPDVYTFCAENITVGCKKDKVTVAIDGELMELETPLNFSVQKSSLKVMVPNVITPL